MRVDYTHVYISYVSKGSGRTTSLVYSYELSMNYSQNSCFSN